MKIIELVSNLAEEYNRFVKPLILQKRYYDAHLLMQGIVDKMYLKKRQIYDIHCGRSCIASAEILNNELKEKYPKLLNLKIEEFDAFLAQTSLPMKESVDSAR